MSDEQETTIDEDYRFIDYRLNQLETNLRKGQEKLEREQQNNYKEIMHLLQVMQEGNNEQNKQLNGNNATTKGKQQTTQLQEPT